MACVLEVLPVGLLRDCGSAGALPRCYIRLGSRTCIVPLGGELGSTCWADGGGAAGTSTSCEENSTGSSPNLWPGSAMIELPAAGSSGTSNADALAVEVRFDKGGEDVLVGSTTLLLKDVATKETHRRWLETSDTISGRSNLLQLKVNKIVFRLRCALCVCVTQPNAIVCVIVRCACTRACARASLCLRDNRSSHIQRQYYPPHLHVTFQIILGHHQRGCARALNQVPRSD